MQTRQPLQASALIRDIPDFPQPGILFRDITPVLADAGAFRELAQRLCEEAKVLRPDKILGIESRGFLIGAHIALDLGLGFVLARKEGKLPHQTVSREYALEYGSNVLEVHCDAVSPGERVLIVDDLLATGGTARAAGQMVKDLGGTVAGYLFFIELTPLKGRDKLAGETVVSLIQY